MKQLFLLALCNLVIYVPGSQSLECYSWANDGTECVNQMSTTCQGVDDSCYVGIQYLLGKPKISAGCTTIVSCKAVERLCMEAKKNSPAIFDCDILCCAGNHCNDHCSPRPTEVTPSLPTKPGTKVLRCYDCSARGTSCRTGGICRTQYQCATLVTQTKDGKSSVINTCLTKSSTSCSQIVKDNTCAEIRRTNPTINSCKINCCSSDYCNVGQIGFTSNPRKTNPTRPGSLSCFECLDPKQGCKNNKVTCLPHEDRCGKVILSGENGREFTTALSCGTSQQCSQRTQTCENIKAQDSFIKSCRIECCSSNFCNASPKIHQMYTGALVFGLVTALLSGF